MSEGGGCLLSGVGSLSMKRLGLGQNPNLDPGLVKEECLNAAEEGVKEVLKCVCPTLDSVERRNDVIEYIQSLMGAYLGCQVFPYGSVPLKTYLPDGDIDVTAIHGPLSNEYLPKAVYAVLREEELHGSGEFEVKEIQFIDAEVKLVKCIIENISVDISFNQLGGLCTLCFIEQVDRLVGNDHLFKRSILLVKTWCYYESRILGSHHGLISTYALETMVLYIFHLFHSSLSGPLAVLYRFLDYYSKFDWSKFCISLNGPVSKTTLPDIVVDKPETEGNKLLLSEDFLKDCMDMFSVSSNDDVPKTFPPKYLDIIDPLKEFNNLGRSVHRANFYRIQSAFRYGARKLGQILSLPKERMTDGIKTFFASTLKRYPCNNGPYLPKRIDPEGSIDFSVFSSDDLAFEDEMLLWSSLSDFEDDNKVTEEKSVVSSQVLSESSSSTKTDTSESFSLDSWLKDSSKIEIDVEPLDPPSNLTGDYDSHIRNLLYGQSCLGVATSPQVLTFPQLSWEAAQQSIPLQWDSYPQHQNIGYVEPYTVFAIDSPSSSVCLSNEDKSPSRGTCAYFPTTNFHFEEGLKGGKAGNKVPRDTRKRSVAGSYDDHRFPALHRKSSAAQNHVKKISRTSSGIQFGTMHTSPTIPSGSSLRRSKSEPKENERVLEQSFHLNNEEFPALQIDIGKKSAIQLKNEEEFPPLCVTNDVGKKSAAQLKNEEEFPPLCMTYGIGKKSASQLKNEKDFPALGTPKAIGKKSACRG